MGGIKTLVDVWLIVCVETMRDEKTRREANAWGLETKDLSFGRHFFAPVLLYMLHEKKRNEEEI